MHICPHIRAQVFRSLDIWLNSFKIFAWYAIKRIVVEKCSFNGYAHMWDCEVESWEDLFSISKDHSCFNVLSYIKNNFLDLNLDLKSFFSQAGILSIYHHPCVQLSIFYYNLWPYGWGEVCDEKCRSVWNMEQWLVN